MLFLMHEGQVKNVSGIVDEKLKYETVLKLFVPIFNPPQQEGGGGMEMDQEEQEEKEEEKKDKIDPNFPISGFITYHGVGDQIEHEFFKAMNIKRPPIPINEKSILIRFKISKVGKEEDESVEYKCNFTCISDKELESKLNNDDFVGDVSKCSEDNNCKCNGDNSLETNGEDDYNGPPQETK